MRRLGHRPSDKELMAMLAEVDEVDTSLMKLIKLYYSVDTSPYEVDKVILLRRYFTL